jgi:hypothetical protein
MPWGVDNRLESSPSPGAIDTQAEPAADPVDRPGEAPTLPGRWDIFAGHDLMHA